MLRPVLIGRDERQVDCRFQVRRKLDLGLFGGFLQPLKSHRILAEIDPFVLLELVGEEIDEDLVEVIAAEVGVAIDGEDLEDAVADIQPETSNVPPPRSKTQNFRSSSCRGRKPGPPRLVPAETRRTLSPAISPASLVALRWASLK